VAEYVWVGASGTSWTAASNWTVGGSTPASAPGPSDNVSFSGTNSVNLVGTANCFNLTVSSGTTAFTRSGTNLLTVYGSIDLATGVTWASNAVLTFSSTSPMTIRTRSSVLPVVTFTGGGGTSSIYALSDSLTAVSITFTAGVLRLGSNNLTTGTFNSSNSNSREIDFGTGRITCTGSGSTLWATGLATNLVLSGSSRDVYISNSTGTASTINHGTSTTSGTEANSFDFYITSGSYTLTISSNSTVRNLNFTGTYTGTLNNNAIRIYGNLILNSAMGLQSGASIWTFAPSSGNTRTITSNTKVMDFPVTFSGGGGGTSALADNMTVGSSVSRTVTLVNGTLSLQTFNLTVPVFSSAGTAAREINFGSSGSITINALGSSTVWDTSTITGPLTTSGTNKVVNVNAGALSPSVLVGNLAEANAMSFVFNSSSRPSITLSSTSSFLDLTFAEFFNGSLSGATTLNIYGNLTMRSGMNPLPGSVNFLATSGIKQITSNGRSFSGSVIFNCSGATYSLVDSLSLSASSLSLTNGTLDLSSQTLTAPQLITLFGTKSITFNGGTISCNQFLNNQPTGFTTAVGSGVGKISMTGASSTFVGGNSTFNCTLENASTNLTISSSNTFNNISNSITPCTFTFGFGTTQSVSDFNVSGTAGNLVTITTPDPLDPTQATIQKITAGNVTRDYLNIASSNATGSGAGSSVVWSAGANSVNSGNNTGWIFSVGPSANSGAFFSVF